MGKSRRRSGMGENKSTAETLSKLGVHVGGWITGFYDFIEQEMDDDEIKYIHNHMEDISKISPSGIWRAESTGRTFTSENLTEGKVFSFDGLKAFSKEENIAKQHSLESLSMRGDVTIFKVNKGKAFDVTRELDTHDEQEVWIGEGPWKVDKITVTDAGTLNYGELNIPSKTLEKLNKGQIRVVEISDAE